MGTAKVRLVVAALLFVSWIGGLAYLVVNTRNPVILSRPQLLVADAWIIADVKQKDKQPDPEVTVQKVAWAGKAEVTAGSAVVIANLPLVTAEEGWLGAGTYILPLSKNKLGKAIAYSVTPLPPSPGFVPGFRSVRVDSLGKNKEEVLELISRATGRSSDETKKAMDKREPLVRAPYREAEKIRKDLEKAGARVSLDEEETRIYPATPQAVEQLGELRAQKGE